MNLLHFIRCHTIGSHDDIPSWRARLAHHDQIIQDLNEVRDEIKVMNQHLTGNFVEEMVMGQPHPKKRHD